MVLVEPTLVGREKELEELQRCLDSAAQRKGKTIFISGEAGSGKTRLTLEFLNRARKQGATILTGWCLSNAAVPYFPFFEAFNAYFSGEQNAEAQGATEVSEWLKGPTQDDKLGKPQAFTPSAWKDRTFIAVAKTLTSISARNPVVLFIDDVHWADSASLSLIHYIARAMSSEKVLLLATFRSEQLAADSEGRSHPLVETLRLMKREDLFREIKLGNLGQACVFELAKNMLGGDLRQDLAERLSEESQGNPLFVVESLRMLHERGSLVQERENWRLVSGKLGIPEKIKDIILQRLSTLLHSQRRILEAASVIGERFDAELLALILDQDYLEVADALGMIARTTSLVCSEGEQYRFDHARSRDTVYDEVSPGLRKAYHGKVAEKLESASKDGKLPVSELAYHYSQAGNKERAVKYAIAAGQNALARWSNVEAVKHFTYVLQCVGQNDGWAEDRATAMEGLGDALCANSLFKDGMKIFEGLAENTKVDAVKLRALRKAMESALKQGDARYLLELVKKAEPLAGADRLEYARVLRQRGEAFMIQYMFPASLEYSKTALQIFEEEYSLWDAASAMASVGVIYAFMGMPQQALPESLRSIELYAELGDSHGQMEAYYVGGEIFGLSFLVSEGDKMWRKVIEIDERMKMGAHDLVARANACVARTLEFGGNFEEALLYSLKALELSKKTDSPWTQSFMYSNLTRQYVFLGDLVHAQEYFKKLMEMPPEIRNTPDIWLARTEIIFYAATNQGEKLNRVLEKFEFATYKFKKTSVEFGIKMTVAWALERQGRLEEARILREENGKILRDAEARFEHANLQAHLMTRRQVVVGEEFEMRFDLVNIGRKPCKLVNIKGVVPSGFIVGDVSSYCRLHNCNLEMEEKAVDPFQVETVKLKLKSTESGTFIINPQINWIDDLDNRKTFKVKSVTVTVQPAKPTFEILPGRVATGTFELDRLLYGGIPEGYAVMLMSPASEERQTLIERYVEAGLKDGQTTFYLTSEPGKAKSWAEENPSSLSLFVCSPEADLIIQDLPNIFKLKGVENLTDIDIALTKAFRTLKPSATGQRRICIDVISDVLLQHHAVNTRRWLSSLLPTLKSKGFTILSIIDPEMHPAEETKAILGLFDGEISIYEKETTKGTAVFLKIKRLTGQNYLKDELQLAGE